ncbi:hypothetical protein LZ017_00090 [Pelomonas sp. CA6]|uniref:hypothetical protein n=1 Tax=Pelomonas sp. CA6 TaxID=2907999 RepID=UPI001F4BA525|nr:hypothetical protein [Pelomonas sp. CA6]MCH7341786.1 hypothetical protein [Pelomonas sp. CA6]
MPLPPSSPPADAVRPVLARLAALALGALPALPCQATGGHHAVDDAAILEPGQCQLELWNEQARDRQLHYLGPGCHLFGVELGLNLTRNSPRGEAVQRSGGLQLKWAREWLPGLGAGLVWSATWQNQAPRYAGQTLLIPLSWQPRQDLTLHLNLGRDFRRREPDQTRRGVALEWQPHERWQGLVEWFDDGQHAQRRVGLRHFFNENFSLDVSRAQALPRPGESWWTLGLNWVSSR